MRRLGFVVAAAILATLLLAVASSPASQTRPTLTIRVGSSIVVDGTHFRRHERVKVTATTGAVATVRANSKGAFTVTLRRGPVDRCSALIVRAQGSAGSFAMSRRPPLPACAPMRNQGSAA